MKKTTTLVAVVMSLLMVGSTAFGQDTPPPDGKKKHRLRGKHKVRMKLKPRSGPPGVTVTIRGRGFQAGDVVRFGPHTLKPTSLAPKRIVFAVPEMVQGRHLVVVLRGDQTIAAGKFRLTPPSGDVARHRAPPARDPHAPKGDPDAPKVDPDAPKVDPDAPKVDPKGDPDAPKVDPDAPKVDPDAPKVDPDAPKVDPDAPEKAERRRKRWRRARKGPMVFRFKRSPKPGQFVIRGRNFSPKTTVAVNKQVVEGAKITARRIVFQMPEVQGKAVILLRDPKLRRPLFVGVHEAAEPVPDDAAEKAAEKQRDEAIRKEAREQWKKRRATLAKTRAARLAQYNKRWEELRAQRTSRRAQRLAKLQELWDTALLNNDQVRAELALHAERSARLNRMLKLVEVDGQAALIVRIRLALGREDARHKQRMETLKKALTASAGEEVK